MDTKQTPAWQKAIKRLNERRAEVIRQGEMRQGEIAAARDKVADAAIAWVRAEKNGRLAYAARWKCTPWCSAYYKALITAAEALLKLEGKANG